MRGFFVVVVVLFIFCVKYNKTKRPVFGKCQREVVSLVSLRTKPYLIKTALTY